MPRPLPRYIGRAMTTRNEHAIARVGRTYLVARMVTRPEPTWLARLASIFAW